MHIAEVVTIAKSLPLLRLNTYKSLILSYSADYRRIFGKNRVFLGKNKKPTRSAGKTRKNRILLTKRQENTLIFLQAFPHTFPENLLYWGKIGAFLGKFEALLGKIPCFLGKW